MTDKRRMFLRQYAYIAAFAVCYALLGFAVRSGRPSTPVKGVRLQGSLRALLRGVAAVARDLGFVPRGRGVMGSPTLLLTGVEVAAAAG